MSCAFPAPYDPAARTRATCITDLPSEVLRRVVLHTMGADEPRRRGFLACGEEPLYPGQVFLNASNPAALRDGVSLAFTCRRLLAVFQDALTGVKLVSSWQTEQNTLIAACKIAARNLRAIHVECSAPVTSALKEVVLLRPPVRHFVLIGVNISKALMSDIIFYVGRSLEKLVISAAPSLDDTVVELIAVCCRVLKHLELGGSRCVGAESLRLLFEKVGSTLCGIEFNSLHHASLDESVFCAMAEFCQRLTYVRLLNLRWVTDEGLECLFRARGHQLTEMRLISCHRASVHILCLLSTHVAALEKLNFSSDKGEWISAHLPSPVCEAVDADNMECLVDEVEDPLSIGEKALVQLSRKCRNLKHLSISDTTISDEAMSRLSQACGNSLRILSVRHCSSLGNKTLSQLAMHASSLVSLDVSHLPLIDDDGLLQLLGALPNSLEELQIIGCTGLTDRALQDTIPRFGKRLRVVRLSYCNFSLSAVTALREGLPRVMLCGASNCSLQ